MDDLQKNLVNSIFGVQPPKQHLTTVMDKNGIYVIVPTEKVQIDKPQVIQGYRQQINQHVRYIKNLDDSSSCSNYAHNLLVSKVESTSSLLSVKSLTKDLQPPYNSDLVTVGDDSGVFIFEPNEYNYKNSQKAVDATDIVNDTNNWLQFFQQDYTLYVMLANGSQRKVPFNNAVLVDIEGKMYLESSVSEVWLRNHADNWTYVLLDIDSRGQVEIDFMCSNILRYGNMQYIQNNVAGSHVIIDNNYMIVPNQSDDYETLDYPQEDITTDVKYSVTDNDLLKPEVVNQGIQHYQVINVDDHTYKPVVDFQNINDSNEKINDPNVIQSDSYPESVITVNGDDINE